MVLPGVQFRAIVFAKKTFARLAARLQEYD
jgi:hypothetical protein